MQQKLWHESLDEALRDAVHAIGGPKAAGYLLWPDKKMDDSARYLHRCLDPERSEKLELSQVVMLMKEAKDRDCHTPMAYLATELGYEEPKPKDPETERDRVQREFIAAQERMASLVEQMKKLSEAP